MKKRLLIIFAILLIGLSVNAQYIKNDNLLNETYSKLAEKGSLDSIATKIGDVPIYITNLSTFKQFDDEKYAICRIGTLTQPPCFVIVLIEDKTYTFIDLDEHSNLWVLKEILSFFTRASGISNDEMKNYIIEILGLLEIREKYINRM